MNLIEDITARGYLYQCSNLEALSDLTATHKIAFYVGFDATAQSLHVGNLLQIMLMRRIQQHGHKPIIILGGTTTKIGDPTDRDTIRKMFSDEAIQENIAGIRKSLAKFIAFGDSKTDAIILDNASWLEQINYIEFLQKFGSIISINRILGLESVKLRLERQQSLTFLEFNYSILQAYDFYMLNKNYNCVLQIGGRDQWGNILMGVDLCHKLSGQDVYGLTTPLMTNAAGQKMGKSATGAIWLNEEMLSPYDYYQYWRNCDDADLIKFAKLYAEFNDDELNSLQQLAISDINGAKKQLAFKLTTLCHGPQAAQDALTTSVKIFEHGDVDGNLPTIHIEKETLIIGVPVHEFLFMTGVVSSKSDARRLIQGGGVKINDIKIDDVNMYINNTLLINNEYIKLSIGKKRHVLVKSTDTNIA